MLGQVKAASYPLALMSESLRNQVLQSLADKLRASCATIIAENAKDLALMSPADPRVDRLLLNQERIAAMAKDIETVITLNAKLGSLYDETTRPNGLKIAKYKVPLGVVAVIYESRPNVTIDVFALCFKSGNATILKGGKEAYHSNLILVNLIQQVLAEYHIDQNSAYLLPIDREATHQVLNAVGIVDVCIPRGSQALINFVREHAKVPVIETGAGIVHTYFDASGDLEQAINIIYNAKTRRVSVCNALDCLIIHSSRLADLSKIIAPMQQHRVNIFADSASYQALASTYPSDLLHPAKPEDFGHEFLDYKLAIKTVDSLADAIAHIRHYSSLHSEAIIATDEVAIAHFLTNVDAAAIYVNASTAFTDGAQFGLGAEIGISTQKLHARGPMGLDALTSYKWVIHGNGQVRP